jgi:hypothetical protein
MDSCTTQVNKIVIHPSMLKVNSEKRYLAIECYGELDKSNKETISTSLKLAG